MYLDSVVLEYFHDSIFFSNLADSSYDEEQRDRGGESIDGPLGDFSSQDPNHLYRHAVVVFCLAEMSRKGKMIVKFYMIKTAAQSLLV